MGSNYLEWSKLFNIGSKYFKTNGPKWFQIELNGHKGSQIIQNGHLWFKMVSNGIKLYQLLQMAQMNIVVCSESLFKQ